MGNKATNTPQIQTHVPALSARAHTAPNTQYTSHYSEKESRWGGGGVTEVEHFISRLSSPPFPTSHLPLLSLLTLSLTLSIPPPCCNSQAFISSHDRPAGSGNEKKSHPVFQELSDASASFTTTFRSLILSGYKLCCN